MCSRSRSEASIRSRRTALGVGAVLLAALALAALVASQSDDWRFRIGQQRLRAVIPVASTAPDGAGGLDFDGWRADDLAYWRDLPVGGAFGALVATSAQIDVLVVKGAGPRELEDAPGWITQTDPPGPEGTCGISGHRVTHGHPFRYLDRLTPGATIDLYSPYRRYRYVVERVLRVTPDRTDVVEPALRPRLTLTTCDPPGSAARRLVVQATLVEVRRVTGADIP